MSSASPNVPFESPSGVQQYLQGKCSEVCVENIVSQGAETTGLSFLVFLFSGGGWGTWWGSASPPPAPDGSVSSSQSPCSSEAQSQVDAAAWTSRGRRLPLQKVPVAGQVGGSEQAGELGLSPGTKLLSFGCDLVGSSQGRRGSEQTPRRQRPRDPVPPRFGGVLAKHPPAHTGV